MKDSHPQPMVRHPGDVVRLVIGVILLTLCSWAASLKGISAFERSIFHAINGLPSWLFGPLWVIMQLGSLAAVFAVAAVAALWRRFRLALELAAGGLIAYFAAIAVKDVVGRARPAALLGGVVIHGAAPSGLGYPSGHAAVSAALAAIAAPFLARRWRRWIWVIPAMVGFARVFVGAHFPLDLAGGFLLGWTVGALVHLVAGSPSGTVDASGVTRALCRAGVEVAETRPAVVDARGSTPFLAHTRDGTPLFVKAVGADQRDADMLFKAYRWVLYRDLGDEMAFASPKRQIESEALAGLLAARAGVRTPEVVTIATLGDGTTLLAYRGITAEGLDTIDPGRLSDAVLAALWEQVRVLQLARIAHRDLRLANVMLDGDDRPWVVDFGFADAPASGRALARDVAELLASQATKVAPGRAVRAAIEALGSEQLREALPYLAPAGLSGATRHSLHEHPGRLEELRAVLAASLGVAAPAPVRFARIDRRVLAFVVAAGLLGYGLVVGLAHNQLSHILAHARWGFLIPAAVAYAVTFVGAALVLRGTSGLQLSLRRTLLVTLASSYSNRGASAGRGRMQLGIDYLEVNGLAPEEARDALAAGSLAGAIVHLILLAVVGLGVLVAPRHGNGHFDQRGWVAGAVALVVLAIGAGWRIEHRRDVLAHLRRGQHALGEISRNTRRRAEVFGGSLVVTLGFTSAFVAATMVVRPGAAGLGSALVYLAALPLSALLPVPGGVFALDLFLVLGELADGAPLVPALAAVLLFRLLTYWLVILPGWRAHRLVIDELSPLPLPPAATVRGASAAAGS